MAADPSSPAAPPLGTCRFWWAIHQKPHAKYVGCRNWRPVEPPPADRETLMALLGAEQVEWRWRAKHDGGQWRAWHYGTVPDAPSMVTIESEAVYRFPAQEDQPPLGTIPEPTCSRCGARCDAVQCDCGPGCLLDMEPHDRTDIPTKPEQAEPQQETGETASEADVIRVIRPPDGTTYIHRDDLATFIRHTTRNGAPSLPHLATQVPAWIAGIIERIDT